MKEKIVKLVSAATVVCMLLGIFVPNLVKSAQIVVSSVNNTWHGIGNVGVYTASINGYNNVYCARGGSPLNNGTILNDDGLSMFNANTASTVSSKPQAMSWLLDNIYLTEGTNEKLQSTMKNNLKNVIKTYSNKKDSNGKSILCNKLGIASIDDNWINNAVTSLISDPVTLYATQQFALWHYLNNASSAYNNAMQNSDGTYNAIPNAKADRNYYTALYISLVELANNAQSNGYTSPSVSANQKITLVEDGRASIKTQNDDKTILIGPYKLTNNSSNFSKSFTATVNSVNADKVETVDSTGKAVNVSSKKDAFYFKITYNKGLSKGIKYNFKINVKVNGYKTFATLLTSTNGFQPLITVKREAVTMENSVQTNYEKLLSGNYSLELEKVDSNNSNKKIEGVSFKVKEGTSEAKTYGPTDSNGLISVFINKNIVKEDVVEYTIEEVNVGNNEYIKLKDQVKFYITLSKANEAYVASKVSFEKDKEVKTREVTLQDNSKVNVTATLSGNTVRITIPNKPDVKGKYSLILEKVDSTNSDIKLQGVTFKVKEANNEAKTYGPTDSKGTTTVINNQEVKEKGVKEFTITEVDVGNNKYIKLKDEVKVYVTITETNNTLSVANVSFEKDKEAKSKSVTLEDNSNVNITAKLNGSKVIITIPNKPMPEGKYSLILEKVNVNDQNKKISGVTFNVKEGNNEVKSYGPTSENGTVTVINNQEVKEKSVKEFTITEVNVENNKYIKLKDEIKVYVTITESNNIFSATNISFEKDKETNSKTVALEDNSNVNVTAKIEGGKAIVTIPNKKAVFDLALRKYITKINNQDLQDSREPVITLKDASALKQNGTALYNNPKNPVNVKEGNTVVYKIRIYNEGNIDGYAKEITDYLPTGLEYVENSEINKANGWVATKNEDGTTTEKTKKLADTVIKASNGEEGYKKLATGLNKTDENWVDFWQDVEIECKVKENIGKKQKLVNVAEITNYGYMAGNDFIIADKKDIDKDSEQDNVFGENGANQKSIDNYYESQYEKKTTNNNTEKQTENKDGNNTEKQENNQQNNNNENKEDNQQNNNNEKQEDNNTENNSESNEKSENSSKADNYPGRQDDDDFENLIVEPGLKEFKFVLNKVDEQGKPLIGADFTVKREKDNTSEVLLDNKEVKGTYEVLENNVQFNKTYTYRVIEVESAPEYVNVMEGKYITLKVYMNEKKELVLGNYEKNEEEDYLINKYGFIINNENGTIVKENETDLYEKIKVKVNNQVSPAKVEITIPNALVKKDFDLSLRKFITEIRTTIEGKQEAKQQITNRIPQFKIDEKGNYTYEHTKEPVMVIKDNIVVYTLRVYNEGEVDGYAKEIKDDIPQGLEFLPQYSLNEEYRWKMIDKYGKETTEVSNAVCIVSDYLSKEQEDDAGKNLLKAFDVEKYKAGEIKEPDYKEIKVAFKVNTDPKSEEIIINQAQISDDSDKDGNEVEDKDSTPNKWIEGEDDQDIEKVKVQYFDLALRKWVTQAIVIEGGNKTVTNTGHKAEDDPEEIVKVDLNKSKISDVIIKFGYSIRVSNEGTIAGYAKEISDYIPEGLKFVKEDNPDWEEVDGKVVTTKLENTLLQPGETAEVQIILTWINSRKQHGIKTKCSRN